MGNATSLLVQLGVERLRRLRCARRFQGDDIRLGEVGKSENLAVTPLEPLILVGGNQHCALTTISRDRNGLGQGHVLITADVTLKLTSRNFEHWAIALP